MENVVLSVGAQIVSLGFILCLPLQVTPLSLSPVQTVSPGSTTFLYFLLVVIPHCLRMDSLPAFLD